MMRLVRRLMGGGVFLGTAALVALALPHSLVACANGTNGSYVGDDEAGLLLDSGGRDVNVPPTGDSSPGDGATGNDSGGTGCTGAVVINELKTDGATASDEFVELYNPNSCAVPLSGWALKYESSSGAAGGAGYVFVAGDSIPAKGYFLIAASTFTGKKDATLVNGFAAGAGQVGLVDDKSATVDGVAYGTVTGGSYGEKQSATAPPSNKSIGRSPNGTDTNSNSADFKVLTSPSPGAAN
jgi:hypothetical protein